MRLLLALHVVSWVLCSSAFAEWRHHVVDSLAENRLPTLKMRGRVPHLAFYTDAGLEYAVLESGAWVRDTVDIAASYHNGNPALTLDRDGRPHVAWFRGTPWYAYWDGDEWQREEIDPDSGGDFVSLVLHPTGFPAAAYARRRGLFNYMLKFAVRDSLGWHPELLDSLGGADCVLAVDAAGRFSLAHCESWSNGALYLHTRTDSGWVKETILLDYASQCRMVLDESGEPHISYYWAPGGAFDLRYAERSGGVWRFDIIDPGQQTSKRGWDNSIVRDQAGTYHLSYHAHNELQVRYARGSFGNWHVEVVNAAGGWNLGSSIDVDELDRPCMAYVNEDQSDRLYLSAQYDLTGVEENPGPQSASAEPAATVVRGTLRMADSKQNTVDSRQDTGYRADLLDAAGRKVMALVPGANDVRHLAPGVYFVCGQGTRDEGTKGVSRKVVVTR